MPNFRTEGEIIISSSGLPKQDSGEEQEKSMTRRMGIRPILLNFHESFSLEIFVKDLHQRVGRFSHFS